MVGKLSAQVCRALRLEQIVEHAELRPVLGTAPYLLGAIRRQPAIGRIAVMCRHKSWRDPKLLPGYGWAFPLGDGTVNVGLGMLSTSASFRNTDYRALLRQWLDGTPEEWGYREENAIGKVGGAGLPMGFTRTPHYRDGLLLLGDAGGMVSPFNGEGISAAMESAQIAAEVVVQALARREGPSRERALEAYPRAVGELMGGYYQLGNVFAKIIGKPKIMHACTKYGLRINKILPLVYKGLSGCYDAKGGDGVDRLIAALARVTPTPR